MDRHEARIERWIKAYQERADGAGRDQNS